jgi:hypothetical protein
MSPPIDIDGSEIQEATIDGQDVSEITIDGQQAAELNVIPDSVLAQDLLAWYRFEDGDARDYTNDLDATFADSTAYDGTVNGATFQSSGGVTDFENGANSGAFEFDGSNDKITIDPFNNLPNNEFSVSLWSNKDTTNSNVCFWHMPNSSGDNTNAVFTESDEYRYLSNNNVFDTGIPVKDNTWQHIVATGDGSTASIYVDNSLGATTSYNTFNFEGVFHIGVDVDGGPRSGFSQFFDGQIDDVRIYNRALTESEISDIYNATKP